MLAINTISEVLTARNIVQGYNDSSYGTTLEKIRISLNEVSNQYVELETLTSKCVQTVTSIVKPDSAEILQLGALAPNYNSNDLLATKIRYFLRLHNIENRFASQFDFMVKSLSKHDFAALAKLYNLTSISSAIDIVMSSLFDTVVLIDDGQNMNVEYIRKSKEIIANLMLIGMLYDYTNYDERGICIRSLNTEEQGNMIKTSQKIDEFFSKLVPQAASQSIGAEMYNKIYETVVEPSVDTSEKPVLSVILLGSVPTSPEDVLQSLQECKDNSKGIMFTVFVNILGNRDVSTYLKTLSTNPNIIIVDSLHSMSQIVN